MARRKWKQTQRERKALEREYSKSEAGGKRKDGILSARLRAAFVASSPTPTPTPTPALSRPAPPPPGEYITCHIDNQGANDAHDDAGVSVWFSVGHRGVGHVRPPRPPSLPFASPPPPAPPHPLAPAPSTPPPFPQMMTKVHTCPTPVSSPEETRAPPESEPFLLVHHPSRSPSAAETEMVPSPSPPGSSSSLPSPSTPAPSVIEERRTEDSEPVPSPTPTRVVESPEAPFPHHFPASQPGWAEGDDAASRPVDLDRASEGILVVDSATASPPASPVIRHHPHPNTSNDAHEAHDVHEAKGVNQNHEGHESDATDPDDQDRDRGRDRGRGRVPLRAVGITALVSITGLALVHVTTRSK